MKNILLSLFAIIMCFMLVGCSSKEDIKTVKGNKYFDKYTGIYILDKEEIRIVHYNNVLYIQVYENGYVSSNTTVFLEGKKFEDLDCKFELKTDELVVNSKNDLIPSGTYKRVKPYSNKEIYEDYVGDISLLNNEINGIYKNDKNTIYIAETRDGVIRFATNNNEGALNLEAEKSEENHYTLEMFEDNYDLTFGENKLDTTFKTQDELYNGLSGSYDRISTMDDVMAIKIFAFDDIREE